MRQAAHLLDLRLRHQLLQSPLLGAWLRRRRQGGAPVSLLFDADDFERHVPPDLLQAEGWRLCVTPGLG